MPTFSKQERLCSQSLITQLFDAGERFMAFPFSVRWMFCPNDAFVSPAQIMMVAPKRKLHHAVDRNRTRRLMRECYRSHKVALYEQLNRNNKKIILSVNYIHNEVMDYATMMTKFDKMMTQLQKQIEKEP
jgi:ribonuclease P protein component